MVNGGVLRASTTAALSGYSTANKVSVGSGGMLALSVGGAGQWNSGATDNVGTLLTTNGGSFGSGSTLGIDTTGGSFTYSGNIAGNMGLTKLGGNILYLNGVNSYAGTTTVSGGTLESPTTAALPNFGTAGYVSVANGATLALKLGGAGQWNSGANNDLSNLITANGGNFAAGSMLAIDTTGGSSTYGGTIAGGMGLTKLGGNTLDLTGTNTYTGSTTISGGVLEAATTAALPNYSTAGKLSVAASATLALAFGGAGQWNSGAGNNLGSLLTANGGNFAAGSALGIDTTGGNATYTGAIAGGMGLTKLGVNTLYLTNNNTYTGMTTISGGTLVALGTAAGNVGTFSTASAGITIGPAGTLVGASAAGNAIFGWWTAGTWPTITNSGVMNDSVAANMSLGPLVLSGGTMMATGAGDAWGTWNLHDNVTVTANSLITAANVDLNGYSANGLRTFSVNPGVTLNVTGFFCNGNNNAYTNGLILSGGGTMLLSGNNIYTGATTISSGTLQLGGGGLLGSGNYSPAIANSGSLVIGTSGNQTLGGVISGSGALYEIGSGTTILSANNVYTGATTVSGGVLGLTGSLTGSNVTVNGANAVFSETNTGVIGGAGTTFTLTSGSATLSGSNSYTGGTAVNGGVLSITSTNSLPGWSVSGSYSVAGGAALAVGNAVSDSNVAAILAANNFAPHASLGFDTTAGARTCADSLANPGSGPLGVLKIGGNMLTLTGTNTFSGGTTVSAGVLEAATTAALPNYGTSGAVSVASGATLAVAVGGAGQWNSGASDDLGALLSANSGGFAAGSMFGIDTTGGSFTYAGAIAGTMNLNKLGGNTLCLTGVNTYNGSTAISSGTVQLANANAVANSTISVASPNGLTFAPGLGGTFTIGGLSGGSPFALADTSGGTITLEVGGNGATTTYSGVLGGSGGLTQVGGNLVLANANSFIGLTTITAGTLTAAYPGNAQNVGAVNAAGAGITIGPGGTLVASQTNSLFGYWRASGGNGGNWATITNAGVMNDAAPAGSVALGPLTLSGGTLMATGAGDNWGTWNLNYNVNVAANSLISAANVDLAGTAAGQRTFNVNPGVTLNVTGFFCNGGGVVNGLNLNGGGTMVLGGANTYSGGTSISGGTLQLSGGGLLGSGNYSAAIANSGSLVLGASSNQTLGGTISGTGGLYQAGNAVTILSAANTYSGATTISGGTLQVGNGGNSGTLGTGAVTDNAALVFNRSDAGLAVANAIGGSGSVVQIGAGTTTLSGTNTYTGGTTVAGGVLEAATTAALPNYSVAGKVSVGSGATLALPVGGAGQWNSGASDDLGNLLAANGGNFVAGSALGIDTGGGNFSYSGAITGALGLNKLGGNALYLTGSNSYSGVTTVHGGLLVFSTSSAFPAPQNNMIAIAGGYLAACGPYTSVDAWLNSGLIAANPSSGGIALTTSLSENINLATAGTGSSTGTYGNLFLGSIGANTYSGTLTPSGTTYNLGGGGGALTMVSSLTGANALAIAGPGTVVLNNGGNNYTGGTTISSGTLQLANANAAPNSTISVGPPGGLTFAPGVGTFNVGGLSGGGPFALTDTGGSAITLQAGANNATTTYAGVMSGSGGLTKTGGGNLVLTNTNSYTGLTTISAGTLTAAYVVIAGNNNIGTFNPTGAGVTIGPNGTLVASQMCSLFGPWWATGGYGTNWAAITNSGLMIDTAGANVNLGPVTLSGGTMAAIGAGDAWGTWNLNNTVTVTQNSLISAAAVNLGGNQTAGQRMFTVNPGVTLNVTGYFRNQGNPATTPFGITLNGGGTMVLAGADTNTGPTDINAGILNLANSAALAGGGNISFGGGTLQFSAGNSVDYSATSRAVRPRSPSTPTAKT